jgi:hypothetical protein
MCEEQMIDLLKLLIEGMLAPLLSGGYYGSGRQGGEVH